MADRERGRLAARPGLVEHMGPTGLRHLSLKAARDGWLHVPASATPPLPLAVVLHGSGGEARQGLDLLRPAADEVGAVLVAPASVEYTWDVIAGGYGPDVALLDAALARAFLDYPVDPLRVAIAGFSDGASYALSLGLANGDLFSRVIAFSPGFLTVPDERGRPGIYVTHGRQDRVLPIESCSRRIVPVLRARGYEVEYEEFDGPHVVPAELARSAVEWFVRRPARPWPGRDLQRARAADR